MPTPTLRSRPRERRRNRTRSCSRQRRRRRRRSPTTSPPSSTLPYGCPSSDSPSKKRSPSSSRPRQRRRKRSRDRHRPRGRRRTNRSQSRTRRRRKAKKAKDRLSPEPEEHHRGRHRKDAGPPHIECRPGELLGTAGRYAVEKALGDGASGRVLGCRDSRTGGFVAVKVARAAARQRRHAETEVAMLQKLQKHNPEAYRKYVVQVLDTFDHIGHFCIVFEPLAMSLRGLLQEANSNGLYMADIRCISMQLLNCLAFFHSMGMAHGDLKCTNVMLRQEGYELSPHPRLDDPEQVAARPLRPFEVVVIDYGLATLTDPDDRAKGRRGIRVGARHIRAPEVVLGLDWGVKADLWSLGCLVGTLYTGDRFFRVHEEMEHLAAIEQICEQKVPPHMAKIVPERILKKGVAFDNTGRLAWPECAKDEGEVRKVSSMQSLSETVLPRHATFLTFLRELLEIDPQKRISAKAALNLSFVANPPEGELTGGGE